MLYLFFNLKLLLAYYLSICLCNRSCIAIKKLRITLRNCRDRETVVKENKVTSKKKKQKKEIETKNKQTKKHSKKFLPYVHRQFGMRLDLIGPSSYRFAPFFSLHYKLYSK